MRVRLGLATATVAVAVTAFLAASGVSEVRAVGATTPSPAPHAIDPLTLPQGPGAATTFLAGRVIHPSPTTKPVYLPKAWTQSYNLQLLGNSPRGWIVVRSQLLSSNKPTTHIYRVTRSSRTLIASLHLPGPGTWWFLSNDDQRIIAVNETQPASKGDCDEIQVFDLTGRLLRQQCPGRIDYLGSTKYNLWYQPQVWTGEVPARRWDLSTGRTTQAAPVAAAAALPEHNRLFDWPDYTTSSGYNLTAPGVTKLQSPSAQMWTDDVAADDQWMPVSISPNGEYTVGFDGGSPYLSGGFSGQGIVIGRMSDGSIVQRFDLPTGYLASDLWQIHEMWWENNSSVLVSVLGVFDGNGQFQNRLLRCGTNGTCSLAASPQYVGSGSIGSHSFSHHEEVDWHNITEDPSE